jgi:hypothetical protein
MQATPASPNGPILIQLATEQIRLMFGSGDSLDTRLLGLTGFSVTATGIILTHLEAVGPLGVVPAAVFVVSVVMCVQGMMPRTWEVGPRLTLEAKIVESLDAAPYDVHLGVLRSLGLAFDWDLELVRIKGRALTRSLVVALVAAGIAAVIYSISAFHGGALWTISATTPKARAAVQTTPAARRVTPAVIRPAQTGPSPAVSSTNRP